MKDDMYSRLNSLIKFELVAHKKKPGPTEEFDRSENGPLYGLKGVPFKLLNQPPVNVTLNPQFPKIVNYERKNTYDYDSWNDRVINISDIKKRRYRRHKIYVRDAYGNYILQSDLWKYQPSSNKNNFNNNRRGGFNRGRFNNSNNNNGKFKRNNFGNKPFFKGNKFPNKNNNKKPN
ncbi:hypothetical protein LY90DRAFT_702987 [Neocallimastix californiae]|uniref:Uncharacterized protein n=1 Tax=Neocallimastix californiae TaxID=1754190 RepID=A0A1Y2CTH2_9FUNG|nr:hypothetical protein LY90DRAFT_702987 [Neocallimastix californiae]|eukprot:ORY49655.1 hypothetical protein LY90DRAFT_702987 [Neocallimastix californiae]